MFRDACKQLAGLEAKYDLLNGLSEVQQVVKRDENGLLTRAYFKFERNAKPVGKGITARDELKPFIHVSINLWSGSSAQPPADLYEFEWKGQTYQMWVRVISSDTTLDKTIRQVVGESRRDAGQLQAPGVAPGTVPDRQPSPPAR